MSVDSKMDFEWCFMLTLPSNSHQTGFRFKNSEAGQDMAMKSSHYGIN